MVAQPEKPFRAIVVGAGISGIMMSHALQLAKIDHIVLEKHAEVYSYSGGAIGIWPHTARVIDQCGFLKKFEEGCEPIYREYRTGPGGKHIAEVGAWKPIAQVFEQKTLLMDRNKCVRRMYENLPDMSRIALSKKIVDIKEDEKGVRVILDDGTVEEGDIVIGADGVHSFVREIMWKHANAAKPGTISEKEMKSLFSEYHAIFGASAAVPGLGRGDSRVVVDHDRTALIFTQGDEAFWALQNKTEKRQEWPFKVKYTEADMEQMVRKNDDFYIAEGIKFEELWKRRTRTGMVAVEEGVLEHWHHGRLVLVGDAAHKMSSDIAMGANTAIEGVVTLANILNREVKTNANRHPSVPELSAIFQEYTDRARPRAQVISTISGQVLRLNTFRTRFLKWMTLYIMPWMDDLNHNDFVQLIAAGNKLDYVPAANTNENLAAWKSKGPAPKSYGKYLAALSVAATVGLWAYKNYAL